MIIQEEKLLFEKKGQIIAHLLFASKVETSI